MTPEYEAARLAECRDLIYEIAGNDKTLDAMEVATQAFDAGITLGQEIEREAWNDRESKLIEEIKERLRGDYTDSGMQDAFFRWPIIKRALRDCLKLASPIHAGQQNDSDDVTRHFPAFGANYALGEQRATNRPSNTCPTCGFVSVGSLPTA